MKKISRRKAIKSIGAGLLGLAGIAGLWTREGIRVEARSHLGNGMKGRDEMEKKVFFNNNQIKMAGILFLPDDFNEAKKYPALVISAPAGAVKEQSPSLYGKKMAQKGFLALAFDTSHQGESGGEPRYLENPTERVEDIRCAVDYLTTLPYVDIERIGALGICSGGGYVVNAAMTERRIKAVAGVSLSDPGSWIRDGLDGKTPVEEQIKLLESVGKQRTAEANGAKPVYGPYVPDVVTEDMPVVLKEANNYYRTPRAQHPNSENRVLMTSLDKLIAFSTFTLTESLLTQPLLLVAGSKADTIGYSEKLYERVKCKKEMFKIEGATHVDLYDIPKYVDQAINKLDGFFAKNL
ncbi:alpha/beta hydrolase fold [Lucifera butyrica]|uniref:Alpha/beta hydrolase fold n=1 Tax=Lucifera butyrica TaxID=1351585 RepID=A0A498RAY9_9FIRM|nr:alpha/beta hydrolase [Lucifera butyrica]VBB08601.1 alpha/beta hydrolase fold [Lucifera butyrica]